MQEAYKHLDQHKILVGEIEMVPLVEAYKALELSIDLQLEQAVQSIQKSVDYTEDYMEEEVDND